MIPMVHENRSCSTLLADPIYDKIREVGNIEPIVEHTLIRAAGNSVQDYQYYVKVHKKSGTNTGVDVYMPQASTDFSNIVIISSNGQICHSVVNKIDTTTDSGYPIGWIYFKLPMMTGKGATFKVGIGNGFSQSKYLDYSVFEPYLKNPGMINNSSSILEWTVSGDQSGCAYNPALPIPFPNGYFCAFDSYNGGAGYYSRYLTQYWTGAPTSCTYRFMFSSYGSWTYIYAPDGYAQGATVTINGTSGVNWNSGWVYDYSHNNLSASGTPYVQMWQYSYHNPGQFANWSTLYAGNFRMMKYLDPDVTQGYWS